MGYREVSVVEIREALRRWLCRESLRAIARNSRGGVTISTSQPRSSRLSWTNRAPVVNSTGATTGSEGACLADEMAQSASVWQRGHQHDSVAVFIEDTDIEASCSDPGQRATWRGNLLRSCSSARVLTGGHRSSGHSLRRATYRDPCRPPLPELLDEA